MRRSAFQALWSAISLASQWKDGFQDPGLQKVLSMTYNVIRFVNASERGADLSELELTLTLEEKTGDRFTALLEKQLREKKKRSDRSDRPTKDGSGCYHCGKKGHTQRTCRKLAAEKDKSKNGHGKKDE